MSKSQSAQRALGWFLALGGSLLLATSLVGLLDPQGSKQSDDADPRGVPDPWYFPATEMAVGVILAASGWWLLRSTAGSPLVGGVADPERLVYQLLAKELDIQPDAIQSQHLLVDDLHLDGDDYAMSLVPALKRKLNIQPPLADWESVRTVADLLGVVRRHTKRRNT